MDAAMTSLPPERLALLDDPCHAEVEFDSRLFWEAIDSTAGAMTRETQD